MNPEIGRQRLKSQGLAGPQFTQPVEVVRWLCALQAQDFHQMVWAIGSRMAGGSVEDVHTELATGGIARCWPLRGTLHLVAGEDVAWMNALDSEKRIRADRRRMEQIGLTFADVDRAAEVTGSALAGRGWTKRGDVMTLWQQAGIETAGQRGYHILFHLSQRGMICIGPQLDKEQGIGIMREQLPAQRMIEDDEARAEIAMRYFRSRAPATLTDFAIWTGWTKREARQAIDANGNALEKSVFEGEEYWRGSDISATSGSYGEPLLLAGFDEFLLSYRDRSAVLDAAHAGKVVPGGNGIFQPFIVDDGAVVGTWKRTFRKQSVTFDLLPFEEDSAIAQRALPSMQRYAAFHGVALT